MNRYSSITPSQFDPMSLQEVMMTPLMQRQKHDQLIAQQEMLRQGLAKVDPLDVHMNEALNVKSAIENKLSSQAALLSKEGVNPNTQGEFLALNREYQNLISPTGRLGQINAAKQVYAKNFNDYLEDAQKTKGWSRERALANWNKFSKQYTGFEGDKIANIGQLGAPKKVEVMDVLKDVKSLLGEQVVGEMKASGYNFQPGPDGSMVMVDRSGRRIETSNKPNLQHAQNLINQKLMGKEWQDSIKFEGEDTQNIYGQLTSGINSMLSNKVVDNRSENAQYIAPKESDGSDGAGNMELIVNNEIFKPNSLATNTFIDNRNRLNTLQSKSTLTPEERTELSGLKDFQSNINKDLSNNLEYQTAKKQQDLFYNKYSKNVQTLLKDPILKNSAEFQSSKTPGIFNVKIPSGELLKGGDGKVLNFTSQQMKTFYKDREKTSTVDNKIFEIQNKVTNENSVKYNGYQLVPITPKDETSIKLANETFENALRANPENLLNLTNIEAVDTESGRREGKDLDLTDKKEIQKLFNNSERGNLKIVSFIPKGFSGKPEYIVEFNTKEGNSANLNRYFRSESGSGNLGDGKPVRLKLSYKQSKGDVLNNANGYIQQYLSNKGPINPNTGKSIGRDLALDMRVNADKAVLNDQLSNTKWSDIVTKNTDFSKLNPFIVKQLQLELKRYGLTNDTDDNELQNIINKFIKDNSNKNIYLE